jgi:glycine/D-amino acid oxidase-like deaminating enzyme
MGAVFEANPRPVTDDERKHVLVIGAGLIGLCSALWLQRLGHRVTVVDRDPPLPGSSYERACSYGNACTVALYGCIPVATPGIARRVPGMLLDPKGPLAVRWRYLPHLAPWLRAFIASSRKTEFERIVGVLARLLRHADAAYRPLVADAKAEHLERRDGFLYLYRSEQEFAAAESDNRLREHYGIAVERLDATSIRELEPNLAPVYTHGVLYKDAYTFDDPKALAFALADSIKGRGGLVLKGEARAIRHVERGIEILVGLEKHHADHLVIAAGAYSRALLQQVGDDVLLDTERGYHVMFPAAGRLLNRAICYPQYGFYMTPTRNGLRAAGTVELGGLAAPPRPARTRFIRDTVAQLIPLVGEAGGEWLGFRPSMPDSLPVVSHSTKSSAVTYAFGHGHLGVTLAGVTGRLVADLVSRRAPLVQLDPLRHDRFTQWGRGIDHDTSRLRSGISSCRECSGTKGRALLARCRSRRPACPHSIRALTWNNRSL